MTTDIPPTTDPQLDRPPREIAGVVAVGLSLVGILPLAASTSTLVTLGDVFMGIAPSTAMGLWLAGAGLLAVAMGLSAFVLGSTKHRHGWATVAMVVGAFALPAYVFLAAVGLAVIHVLGEMP